MNLFVKRDIQTRYKGSTIGIVWSILNPLLMLTIYTVVFSQVFKTRWGSDATAIDSPMTFAMNLFAGLIVFNVFAECMTRSPGLITENPSYVKKIRFPLEILGIMITGSSLFHALTSVAILMVGLIATEGQLQWTLLYLPLYGYHSYLDIDLHVVSTICVFVKDLKQLIGTITSAMMFLSPIFYPSEMIPEKIRFLAQINPLAIIIEQTRSVAIRGEVMDIKTTILLTIISIIWCEFSLRLLKKASRRFADVI